MKYENIKKTTVSDRIVYFKSQAKSILSGNGNLLKLIFANIICISFAVSYVYLFSVLQGVTGIQGRVFSTLAFFLLLVFVAPSFFGILRMAYLMSEGKRVDICDVLYLYGSVKRMLGVYGAFFFEAAYILFFSVLSIVIGWLASFFCGIESEILPSSSGHSRITLIIILAIFALTTLFMKKLFVLPSVLFRYGGTETSEMIKKSTRAVSGHGAEIIRFNLSFLVLAIISLLTFGTLFVVYTLPFYTLARMIYSSYLLDLAENKN